MSILGELQLANGQAWVELFEIDATAQGGDITRFHAGTNGLRQPVVWQGNTYEPFPIMASGFEASGQQMARPKLAVANVNGLISAMLMQADLLGAKVIRRRTMVKFLDDVNFPIVQKPTPAVLTFTRASTATYYGSDGLLKTAAANQPRIEYDPLTLAVRGLLIEEQRTNIVRNSQQFDNATWTKQAGVSVTATNVLAPDGTNTACEVTWDTAGAESGIYSISTVSVAGAANTKSIWVRADVAGGTVKIVDPSLTVGATVATLTTQWQRITLSEPAGSQPSFSGIWLRKQPSSPSKVYIWGAQVEVGAFATSYIPTTTAAVTRSADFCSASLSAIGYNASESGILVEYDLLWSVTSVTRFIAAIDTSGRLVYSSGGLGVSIYDGTNVVGAGTVSAPNTLTKTATTFGQSTMAGVTNGGAVTVGAFDGTFGAGGTELGIGRLPANNNTLCGHIKTLRYYPRRLTNSKLQTITSGGTVDDLPAFELDTSGGSLAVYTLAQWNPTADPNSYLPDDIWYISQKTTENAQVVEFELASPVDLEGVMIPGRQIQPNLCAWRYRGEGCGYAGGPVADANDNPTAILANDRCSKRTSGCKLRWGSNAELPFGGFPGAGLVRR